MVRQPTLDSARVKFDPLDITVASDTTLALVYGVVALDNARTGTFVLGRYLMAWSRPAGTWTLAAAAFVNLLPPNAAVADSVPAGSWVLPDTAGPAGAFVLADRTFADSAGKGGGSAAFRHWAAPDAVTFASTGQLNRGPEAIAAALRRLDSANWAWYPIGAGASRDGTIGWTVGNAILIATEKGSGGQAFPTHYLTFWRRSADGEVRFTADGGSAQPGP